MQFTKRQRVLLDRIEQLLSRADNLTCPIIEAWGGGSLFRLDPSPRGDDRGTGYDVVLWIEEQVALHDFVPPTMKVHSANVSARTKMENGIRAIEAMVTLRGPERDSNSSAASCSTSEPACLVCGGSLIHIRGKWQCSVCHRICETCCEGGRG